MSSSNAVAKNLNPRTTSYEFLGPPGALFISLAVPITTYTLYFGCSEATGGCPPSLSSVSIILETASKLSWWKSLWDTQATLLFFGWYAFCLFAWFVLPGDWIEGVQLRNGKRMKYKINAFSTLLLTLGITLGYILRFGPESFTFFYDKWVGFVTASILFSTLQGIAVYAASFKRGKLLALGGNSGNHIYDFFIGRELNPTMGPLDIKSFNELRPGLILWILVDISMACEQAVRRGGLGQVTDSMWLVLAFQAWYVADGLYNEPAIFTTMDITTDGLGFMLIVGLITWLPFVYSLQARYLVFNQLELGPMFTSLIIFVNLLGYYIFRAANGEKDQFRKGQNPNNLKFMATKSGSKLLIEGWWGWSRHPNYLGDILMALAWSLPTGFKTPITYFYVIYFAVLLIHRQRRDDEHCHKKYGSDWDKYTKIVPYRIIRYIY